MGVGQLRWQCYRLNMLYLGEVSDQQILKLVSVLCFIPLQKHIWATVCKCPTLPGVGVGQWALPGVGPHRVPVAEADLAPPAAEDRRHCGRGQPRAGTYSRLPGEALTYDYQVRHLRMTTRWGTYAQLPGEALTHDYQVSHLLTTTRWVTYSRLPGESFAHDYQVSHLLTTTRWVTYSRLQMSYALIRDYQVSLTFSRQPGESHLFMIYLANRL